MSLQDLTAYKKYKEKAVASAARSLITLFREIAPYMLEKKDRGRGADLEARPMQYGAGQVRVSHLLPFCWKPSIQRIPSVLPWEVDYIICHTYQSSDHQLFRLYLLEKQLCACALVGSSLLGCTNRFVKPNQAFVCIINYRKYCFYVFCVCMPVYACQLESLMEVLLPAIVLALVCGGGMCRVEQDTVIKHQSSPVLQSSLLSLASIGCNCTLLLQCVFATGPSRGGSSA